MIFKNLRNICDRVLSSLFLVSLVLVCSCTKSDDSEKASTNACNVIGLTEKIVNGTECSESGSAVVKLTLLAEGGEIGTCSGTMISSTKVLTAAHCFREMIRGVSVLVEGRDIPVSSYSVHPEVNLPQNDVAIVTLSRPVGVSPIPLLLSRPVESGNIISILGFGVTEEPNSSGLLRSGQMEVSSVNSQSIVAESFEESSNTCFGDSGGPALLTIKGSNGEDITGLVGVTSGGTLRDCGEGDRSTFANLQATTILNYVTDEVPGVAVR